MTDINLQTLTPDTTLPTTGFLFGADSQASGSPSVFTVQSVATTLLGSTTLSGATITADAPVLNLAQTWNNAAITFTGLKLNATDTASASGSLLMDLQVGGTSRFSVAKAGSANFANDVLINNSNGLRLNSSGGYIMFGLANDIQLYRDAANILAQRNGVNAQAFRLYNTFTDASNYERLSISWATNILNIGTAQAGTGASRQMLITAARISIGPAIGTVHWFFDTDNTGALRTSADNLFDIGINGSGGRPRNLFMASYIRNAVTTVGALPAAATAGAGAQMFVSDALSPTFGAAVAAGGAVTVPVHSTGTAWNVG